jgi:hypothetical protein
MSVMVGKAIGFVVLLVQRTLEVSCDLEYEEVDLMEGLNIWGSLVVDK